MSIPAVETSKNSGAQQGPKPPKSESPFCKGGYVQNHPINYLIMV